MLERFEEEIKNSVIVKIENGPQIQPMIVIKNENFEEYLISISNDHRFIISKVEKIALVK